MTNIEFEFAEAVIYKFFTLEIKVFLLFKYILYIYYLFCFWKDKSNVKALINFSSEINAMILAYTKKIDFQIEKTNIKA